MVILQFNQSKLILISIKMYWKTYLKIVKRHMVSTNLIRIQMKLLIEKHNPWTFMNHNLNLIKANYLNQGTITIIIIMYRAIKRPKFPTAHFRPKN